MENEQSMVGVKYTTLEIAHEISLDNSIHDLLNPREVSDGDDEEGVEGDEVLPEPDK